MDWIKYSLIDYITDEISIAHNGSQHIILTIQTLKFLFRVFAMIKERSLMYDVSLIYVMR